jgi:hypothetical protein
MPKMVEITEEEHNQLQALRGVAAKIVAKPESRRLLEQAQKLVDPNAATPLLDQEAAQLAPVKAMETALNERIAKFEKERDDEKRESTLRAIADKQTAGLSRLRKAGYTDEGVAAVQKLMEDKGLLDVDDAVAIFERANPPQMPSTPSGGMTGTAWGFADNSDSDKSIQELIANKGEGNTVDKMAIQALQDFRSGR